MKPCCTTDAARLTGEATCNEQVDMKAPVIYLTFANIQGEYLSCLRLEESAIRKALENLEDKYAIQVSVQSQAQLKQIFEGVERFSDRLAIFHYAGHAGESTLRLDGKEAQAAGIAQLLGSLKGLKLVFLNGCATGGQVKMLLEEGVQAVIATSAPVSDDIAMKFAERFYIMLAKNEPIKSAFRHARSFINTSEVDHESVETHRGLQAEWGVSDPKPVWGLFTAEGAPIAPEEYQLPASAPVIIADDPEYSRISKVNVKLTATFSKQVKKYSWQIRELMNPAKFDLGLLQAEMVNCLPLPIGEEVKRLFKRSSKGEEDFMHLFSPNRLNQLYQTYRATVEFVCFILLSQLWDEIFRNKEIKNKEIKIDEERRNVINDFFTKNKGEYKGVDYLLLITAVTEIFDQYKIEYFLSELVSIKQKAAEGDRLNVHRFMTDLKTRLDSNQVAHEDLKDLCIQGEEELGQLLSRVAFLAKYKLATITRIEIIKRRHTAPKFQHFNIQLNRAYTHSDLGDLRSEEFLNYTDNASVLFLNKEEGKRVSFLSMSPFIIDVNASKNEVNSKLYTFAYEEEERYYYKFVNDPAADMLVLGEDTFPEVVKEMERFKSAISGEDFSGIEDDKDLFSNFFAED